MTEGLKYSGDREERLKKSLQSEFLGHTLSAHMATLISCEATLT